jgi:hypothetical protein
MLKVAAGVTSISADEHVVLAVMKRSLTLGIARTVTENGDSDFF